MPSYVMNLPDFMPCLVFLSSSRALIHLRLFFIFFILIRMMDPVIKYYGNGLLSGFPVDPNGVLDVVSFPTYYQPFGI